MESFEPKKLALIRIWQILKEYSDYDHPLTQDDIARHLENDYGIVIERKAISRNISLLKEAGYKNGFSFTITVPSNYKVHVDTAQVVVSQLKNIGIKAAIKQVDWPTWLSDVYTNKNYEATIVSFDSSVLAPNGFLGRYVTGASNNFLNYSNEKFDSVYQKATIDLDEKNRVKLYKDAQKILAEDAASVYIQDISNITVMKKQYSGFTSYPMYVFDAAAIK